VGRGGGEDRGARRETLRTTSGAEGSGFGEGVGQHWLLLVSLGPSTLFKPPPWWAEPRLTGVWAEGGPCVAPSLGDGLVR